jgi:hypothetical protein
MGDVFKGTEKLAQFDVDRFAVAGASKLTIESKPGDLLLNKDGGAQNLAVGAPFELTVEPGKPGHADGLVAYCIDLHHHVPSEGQGFDVLGPAGRRPEPSLQYLQRVLEVAATLQATALVETPGAQDAVWRISDDSSADDGAAILALAGIPDTTFNTPHFVNPNAASPETSAVSPTGVLPDTKPVPDVKKIHVSPGKLPAGKRLMVKLEVTLAGARDKVRFELQRRKSGQWRPSVRFPARKLRPGSATVRLQLPALQRGAVRIVAIGGASSATVALKIR